MAAIPLRQIADRAPELAVELTHTAAQIETEAADLETPPLPVVLPRLHIPRPPRRSKRLH
jgi:hypothetical protein